MTWPIRRDRKISVGKKAYFKSRRASLNLIHSVQEYNRDMKKQRKKAHKTTGVNIKEACRDQLTTAPLEALHISQ